MLLLLQLYKEAGVPTRTFIGVPVFQAEGLTVTAQEMVSGSKGRAAFVVERLDTTLSCGYLHDLLCCVIKQDGWGRKGLITSC